jgi:hypothetical protein
MKISAQRFFIPGLAVLCGISALALIPAFHLPGPESRPADGVRAIQVPGLESFNEAVPIMQEVAAKHLFIPERKATGQNAFPDLAVKGIFLGTERSAVFSLKSKPLANLRIWEGGVERALSQIVDPRDPRQPIAQFLREWKIKEIGFSGVQVEHFITGEVQTYAVDYTPEKKVKDDASRGYGQGIIPQGEAGQAAAARTAGTVSTKAGQQLSGAQPINQTADRISAMIQRMTPDQKKQFLQRVQQNMTGANQKTGTAPKPAAQTGSKKTGNTKTQPSKKK